MTTPQDTTPTETTDEGRRLSTPQQLALAARGYVISHRQMFRHAVEMDSCTTAALSMHYLLESCLLAYACLHAKNREVLGRKILKGRGWTLLERRLGDGYMDGFLVERLAREHPWVRDTHELTCAVRNFAGGYISMDIRVEPPGEEYTVDSIVRKEPTPAWLREDLQALYEACMQLLLHLTKEGLPSENDHGNEEN